MEDVLDLYAEAPDPKRPLVCFDETPVQLIGEVRQPIPAQPGQRERYDYEYRRNGTVNLFVTFDPHHGWRNVKVTGCRAAVDYAHCIRELVDVHYPDAACIRVVQDNLSIHTAGALYQAFAPAEARRILRRLEFHFTPKHASWLNMVECEISVLQRQCLGRRIDDSKRLRNEIAAWQRRRNKIRARIKWMSLRVWDLDSGEDQSNSTFHTEKVNDIGITPDGRRAIAGWDRDRTARVFNSQVITVEEGSLCFHIANPRKVVGDGKNGTRYTTTASGRGYCLVAPIFRCEQRSRK
jgi:hypothetical protein